MLGDQKKCLYLRCIQQVKYSSVSDYLKTNLVKCENSNTLVVMIIPGMQAEKHNQLKNP